MRRLSLICCLLLVAASCGGGQGKPQVPPDSRSALQRASAWLWARQADDGGWHSDTYGLMRSGQSLTPFVLHALLCVPEDKAERPPQGVERALAFIRRNTNSDGCLGRSDPDVADYPNHATAWAVRCLVAAGNESDRPLISRMCDYLRAQQFGPANGVNPKDFHWGGWGFGSESGVMDIGHTRHALQALRDADDVDAETTARAQAFLRLLQRHPEEWRPQPEVPGEAEGEPTDSFDGGFYFSSTDLAMNKGGYQPASDGHAAWFRSYATATCNGLLALLAAGVQAEDPRVAAAASWLDQNPGLEFPAGVPAEAPTPWHVALHYYHLAVRAEAWAVTAKNGTWRAEIARHLQPLQRKDGSFINEQSPLMKENDPVLCTALAVIALGR